MINRISRSRTDDGPHEALDERFRLRGGTVRASPGFITTPSYSWLAKNYLEVSESRLEARLAILTTGYQIVVDVDRIACIVHP